MSKKVTLKKALALSESGERIMLDTYLGLADKFSSNKDISVFWKDMAEDEAKHIKELEEILSKRSEKKLQSPVHLNSMDELKETLEFNVKENLKSIKNLEDAFQIAHRLETSEINNLFHLLSTEKSSEDVKNLLRSKIEDHLEKLLDFSKSCGDSETRKDIECRE